MSQRDTAMEEIRRVLLSGQISVGERTSERRLTENYLANTRLGRTPVREALALLTEYGIVEQYPQAGFAVRRVDQKEAERSLELERVTEALVVAEAARAGVDLRPLDGLADKLLATVNNDPYETLEAARDFHTTLSELAGYQSAVDVIGGFRDRLCLFLIGSRVLTPAEQTRMTTEYKQLVHEMRDASGNRGRRQLDCLIDAEIGMVRARVAPQSPVAARELLVASAGAA